MLTMKLAGFDIYRYTLPFTQPVILKGERLDSREGLLISLTDETGKSGWGEISPLPGFSRESLQDAEHQLYKLASSFVGATLPKDLSFSSHRGLPPSVRFGFELASYNLYAKSQGETLPELLSESPGKSVALNGLLSGSGELVIEEARRMRDAGYEAVKLKVGTREVTEDAELVEAVVEILGGDVALRLDANRAWSFEEAVDFFRATSTLRFEYVEEPLAEPAELPRLVEEYGVPVALDESLVGMEAEELENHRCARAVVLKPTLLGGLSRALGMSREAERLGIVPVVSSAYETGVGTGALISLSASIGGGKIPAGLDTYRRLKEDVIDPALDLSNPHVSVSQVSAPRALNHERLKHVYSSET